MSVPATEQKELPKGSTLVLWSGDEPPNSGTLPEIKNIRWLKPLLMEVAFPIFPGQRLPQSVFSRQWLPNAREVQAESIRAWASQIVDSIIGLLPDDQPWSLHVEPHYGARATHRIGARAWHSATREGTKPVPYIESRNEPMRGGIGGEPPPSHTSVTADAGRNRCDLIRKAVVEMLQKRRRHLLRHLRPEPVPFTPQDSLVQVLLLAPDTGYISLAPAPIPFEQRHLVSPFPKGEIPMASDKAAPSRAFAKLVEAELRFGRRIQQGETCVDLGAAPGSWTYVAVTRGARAIAVDRSPLREDLMRNRLVQFQPGDAFRFRPDRPVDWLLCDIIAAPDRSAALLLEWLRHAWCKHFVVTIKMKETAGYEALIQLQTELPPLTSDLYLTHLCANKKEVCAFGSAKAGS